MCQYVVVILFLIGVGFRFGSCVVVGFKFGFGWRFLVKSVLVVVNWCYY